MRDESERSRQGLLYMYWLSVNEIVYRIYLKNSIHFRLSEEISEKDAASNLFSFIVNMIILLSEKDTMNWVKNSLNWYVTMFLHSLC